MFYTRQWFAKTKSQSTFRSIPLDQQRRLYFILYKFKPCRCHFDVAKQISLIRNTANFEKFPFIRVIFFFFGLLGSPWYGDYCKRLHLQRRKVVAPLLSDGKRQLRIRPCIYRADESDDVSKSFLTRRIPSQTNRHTKTQKIAPVVMRYNHQNSGIWQQKTIVMIRLNAHRAPSMPKRIQVALRVLSFLKPYLNPE